MIFDYVQVPSLLTGSCLFCVVIEAPMWKRWAAVLAFPGSIPDGGGTLFNCKRSSIAHSLSLLPYRCSDMLEIPLKRRKKNRVIHLCVVFHNLELQNTLRVIVEKSL